MQNTLFKKLKLGVAIGALGLAGSAYAIPSLQLDILGGTYDASTETVVSAGDVFKLYAYLIPDASATLAKTYYLSAAITPKLATPATLGSIVINGTTIDVTDDMTFGTPPLDGALEGTVFDDADLAAHGIFPTYFYEISFSYAGAPQAAPYNTEDDTGDGPVPHPGTGMYYKEFMVDVSGLNPAYEIHFDLYNQDVKDCKGTKKDPAPPGCVDLDASDFAPFSHDAQSGNDDGTPPGETPVPGTLALLGLGLAGLWSSARRK